MKLLFICVGFIALSLLLGYCIGAILPEPISTVVKLVAGWLFGWYVAVPVILSEVYK